MESEYPENECPSCEKRVPVFKEEPPNPLPMNIFVDSTGKTHIHQPGNSISRFYKCCDNEWMVETPVPCWCGWYKMYDFDTEFDFD